jgi:ABC-type branched-subunit amino acid transport system permease subunit
MRRSWPLPPLLADWPWAVRIVLAGIVPIGFGFLCGALLGSSGALFLGLQVLAAIGGYTAGLEHSHPRHGRLRGVLGGLLFGGSILLGHESVGGSDHGLLPHPELLQLVITVTLGALLGSLGAYTRMRIESRRPAGESP